MDIKILTSDDWEALYVDGESVEQAHKISRSTIAKILIERKYNNATYSEYWLKEEDNHPYMGRFPERWCELEGYYE